MSSLVKSIALIVVVAAASAQQPPATSPNPPSSVEDAGDFLVVQLKNTTAYDIGFTVEGLLKSKNGTGPSLDEGPDEKTLIVRNFKPAQKENILKMIAMFDVAPPPDKEGGKPKGGKYDSVPNPRAQNVKVFPLQHTTPTNILETLIPLFKNASLVGDPSTNSVIVSSTNADIAIMADLLAHLDKASDQERHAGPSVRSIQLKHRATDDVSKKLMSLLGGMRDRDARVASDEGRGKVILRGSTDFLEFASQVITELDVPAQMIQFEFAFFSADQYESGELDSAHIPINLQAIAKELQRFGRVRLLGRLACNAAEDHQFVLEGALGDGLSAKVSGTIINAVADGSIQLNVQGRVLLTRAPSGEAAGKAPPHSSAFEVNSTVVTKRGDTVMIGSAPAGWSPGESAIMVLQAK